MADIVNFLTKQQIESITQEYKRWYSNTKTEGLYMLRQRHWIIFLILRYTGAKISEVLQAQYQDINFRRLEIKLVTLRQKELRYRSVPLPSFVLKEVKIFLRNYPYMKPKLFSIQRANFFKIFKERSLAAGIPKELAHPHILRHTRAKELADAGMPAMVIQKMMGFSSVTTTNIYYESININNLKEQMKRKGLL